MVYIYTTGQLTARRSLGEAMTEAGFTPAGGYPGRMSLRQALSAALPFLPAASSRREVDVQFGEAEGLPLLCDVYCPNLSKPGAPVLLYIHGGAWFLGDKYHSTAQPVLQAVAAAGYPVVSINYRLAPHTGMEGQVPDLTLTLTLTLARTLTLTLKANLN